MIDRSVTGNNIRLKPRPSRRPSPRPSPRTRHFFLRRTLPETMKMLFRILCASLVAIALTDSTILDAISNVSADSPPCGTCRWAVCQWRRNIIPNRQECQFVSFNCECPTGTSCQLTDTVKPGPSDILTFYYQCRA